VICHHFAFLETQRAVGWKALQATGHVALARVGMYGREHVVVVRPGSAVWNMNAKAGMARVKKLANGWSVITRRPRRAWMEALEECFTINRLDIPPSLHRCLVTTNLIESPHSGVRMRTRRAMVKRWMPSAFLASKMNCRKMMGYRIFGLWKRSSMDRSLPPDRRWRSDMGTNRRLLSTKVWPPSESMNASDTAIMRP
jgi:hypothetical protein